MAPELSTSRVQVKYDFSADIWGFGIVLWESLHRCPPHLVRVSHTPLPFEKRVVESCHEEIIDVIQVFIFGFKFIVFYLFNLLLNYYSSWHCHIRNA